MVILSNTLQSASGFSTPDHQVKVFHFLQVFFFLKSILITLFIFKALKFYVIFKLITPVNL